MITEPIIPAKKLQTTTIAAALPLLVVRVRVPMLVLVLGSARRAAFLVRGRAQRLVVARHKLPLLTDAHLYFKIASFQFKIQNKSNDPTYENT